MTIIKGVSSRYVISVIAYVLVSGVAAQLVSQDTFKCPENWGYYEDPNNCIKYYRCENGVAHSLTCRKGNIYSGYIIQMTVE